MNYQHSYHAGNFADVVKHILQIQLLNQMMQKPKPLQYVDAYAGRGMYKLNSSEAKRTGEAKSGIKALLESDKMADLGTKNMPQAVADYIELVNSAKEQFGGSAYPGSPWIGQQMLREGDKAHVFEYQETEYDYLKDLFFGEKNIGVHHRDAFEGVKAFAPPPRSAKQKRGLVLLDPPYEQEHKDFSRLVKLLEESMQKWDSGVYALWYPIKDRSVVDLFEKKMKRTNIRNQLVCELCVLPDDTPIGLNGTGLLVINPPWQFAQQADKILKYLLPILRVQPDQGHASVRWLVGE